MPSKLPRVNVTVTEEQHALLLELAQLQGGSAAGFLRQQLDASTPLLRAAVPLLRRAAQETELTRKEAAKLLQEPLRKIREMGLDTQLDFIADGVSAPDDGSERSERSKRGREEEGAGSSIGEVANG